jgi:hypothetical protein
MKRKTVSLRLPREQLAVLRAVAKNSGVSMTSCVCVILTLGMMRAMTLTTDMKPPTRR